MFIDGDAVLFTSDIDPSTGRGWCPDCSRADDAILAAANAAKVSVLVCRVGTHAAWRDAKHPLRLDKKIKLTSIPTLMRWHNDAPGPRLDKELEACGSPAQVTALVEPFFLP